MVNAAQRFKVQIAILSHFSSVLKKLTTTMLSQAVNSLFLKCWQLGTSSLKEICSRLCLQTTCFKMRDYEAWFTLVVRIGDGFFWPMLSSNAMYKCILLQKQSNSRLILWFPRHSFTYIEGSPSDKCAWTGHYMCKRKKGNYRFYVCIANVFTNFY